MEDLFLRRRELMNKSGGGGIIDPYVLQPFTMIAKARIDVDFYYGGSSPLNTYIKYNLNNTGWVTKNATPNTYFAVEMEQGDTLQIIGDGPFADEDGTQFEISPQFMGSGSLPYGGHVDLEGNIMSLIGGDNFLSCTIVPDYCFNEGLFNFLNDYIVRDVTNLRMSATTVGNYALRRLFNRQMSLIGSAKNLLPAATIGAYCYYQMFSNCSFLTTPPDLPATTVYQSCYQGMFTNCTRMTSCPDLPATTLATDCYRSMFSGCSNITTPGIVAATTLASTCCRQMFNNCSALTTAPVLHATTLVSNCYYRMFYGCSSLSYIKAMFTTTPSTSYTNGWVTNVASSGTFVKNSAANWNVSGANGVPSGWIIQTASA